MYSLCCISEIQKAEGIKFQTMTWKRFNQLKDQHGAQHALNLLGDRWLNNLMVTRSYIEHCYRNGWGYRISSALFPILTHPEFEYGIEDVAQHEEIMINFSEIAEYNKEWGVRLSCHPDQFNVLASDNEKAVAKTIKELNHQGWVMDMMGCERSYQNPMNIHINNTKGEFADIACRFMTRLRKCDDSVQSRLVVENEDRGCWTAAKLVEYLDIPVTYDILHDKCNPSEAPEGISMTALCASTWGSVKPLFHYCESIPEGSNPRKHADMPTDCPTTDRYDWDVELRQKDFAIRECERLSMVLGCEE